MTKSEVDANALILWDYLQVHQKPMRADAILALGSMDTRVAEYAADLFNKGLGEYLIFSGGVGKLTEHVFDKPEAQLFAEIAQNKGVPADKIIIEDTSTNTGENIQFTHRLLAEKNIHISSLILVQKPYMERRTLATFKKQWPDIQTTITVTSPPIPYERYFNDVCPRDLVLNVMTGDMQRIKEYPALGFQIAQNIPPYVWNAYQKLVDAGYTSHLLK